MKKISIVILSIAIFIVIYLCGFPNADAATTKVLDLSSSEDVCNAVKSNNRIKIYVYDYYSNSSTLLTSKKEDCVNAEDYDSSQPWTQFGRNNYNVKLYSDDTLIKEKGEYGKYSSFYISNASKTSGSSTAYTLTPGQKIWMKLDLTDKNLTSNAYKDLRLFIDYERDDINIAEYNSISYYVYTPDKTYGPYKVGKQEPISTYNKDPSKGVMTVIYRLCSENLVQDIPIGTPITGIKIMPFDNYNKHVGKFRIYGMFLNGYNSDYNMNKTTVSQSNAEDIIRHNIVNNFLEEATVKWSVSSTSPDVYYYHHYTGSPLIFAKEESSYYGIPYVSNNKTTMSAFLHRMTKKGASANCSSSSQSKFCYNFPAKYTSTTTTYNGNTVTANTSVGNTLYLLETNPNADNKVGSQRYNDINNLNFVINDDTYILGVNCAASTFLAYARELPYYVPMNLSDRYYNSFDHRILGDIVFYPKLVENWARSKGKLTENQEFDQASYKELYGEYLRDKYKNSKQTIYNAYGLVIPGDIIDTKGHVRIVSGYSHVECNDGRVITKYQDNACGSSGINPTKSYVIIMEVGNVYKARKASASGHVNDADTGWQYSFNSSLTDVKSVDELYDSKRLSTFTLNKKYYFSELFNFDDSTADIYLPFRYKAMDRVSENKIELPDTKILLDKQYSNIHQAFLNKVAEHKKLQGTISTNYMINIVKIVVNNKVYLFYPDQTNIFSLANRTNNSELQEQIKNLDYSKTNSIKVFIKIGPNLDSFKTGAHVDSNGYVKVLDTTGLTAVAPVKTQNVSINETTLYLPIGETAKINATVTPSNADDKTIIWTSSGPNVVGVDSNGVITAYKTGKVTITATTRDTKKTDKITINAYKPVDSINFNKDSYTMYKNGLVKLAYTITPSDATNQKVSYMSSNSNVATVDLNGNVTALNKGTATITITTEDGNKTSSTNITVEEHDIPVQSVSFDKEETIITLGKTETLRPIFDPLDSSNKEMTWTSSNSGVASVSTGGVIVARKVGRATITGTSTDSGVSARIVAIVVDPSVSVTGLTLDKTSVIVNEGSTSKVTATITPDNADNKTVLWTSSNDDICMVSSDGLIKGIKQGECEVLARAADNTNYKETVNVTVIKEEILVTRIDIEENSITLDNGEQANIVTNIVPANASNKTLTWTSSNSNVASVDQDGVVHAISPGNATITVESSNGVTNAITVTVNEIEEHIEENETALPADETYNDPLLVEYVEEIYQEELEEELENPIPQEIIDRYSDPSNNTVSPATNINEDEIEYYDEDNDIEIPSSPLPSPTSDNDIETPTPTADNNIVIPSTPLPTPTEKTLKSILQSNDYNVSGNYTFKFTIGDSISSIKNKLGSGVTIESKTTTISTGTIIKKGNESYTVVIKGDLNGDGRANSGDLLQMRKYLLEEITLIGAYKEAGIIESNGNIKSLDLLRLRQYLLGEYKLN